MLKQGQGEGREITRHNAIAGSCHNKKNKQTRALTIIYFGKNVGGYEWNVNMKRLHRYSGRKDNTNMTYNIKWKDEK